MKRIEELDNEYYDTGIHPRSALRINKITAVIISALVLVGAAHFISEIEFPIEGAKPSSGYLHVYTFPHETNDSDFDIIFRCRFNSTDATYDEWEQLWEEVRNESWISGR